jgi:hypothetical protein
MSALRGGQEFILLSEALAGGCFELKPAIFNWAVDNMKKESDLSSLCV